MREGLKNINNVRKRFIATFERYGKKSGWKGVQVTTLLFVNVRDKEGKVYADHIWFSHCKGFGNLDLKEGDEISFDARVKPYLKGYKGRRDDFDLPPVKKDYKLSHPNNFVKHIQAAPGMLF